MFIEVGDIAVGNPSYRHSGSDASFVHQEAYLVMRWDCKATHLGLKYLGLKR
jgi:hypothetical protein